MAYIVENMVQYDLSEDDVEKLTERELIIKTDDPDRYETTALVWNDLGLEGNRAYRFFDLILGRIS